MVPPPLPPLVSLPSLSLRRAWIEIAEEVAMAAENLVALLTESVD